MSSAGPFNEVLSSQSKGISTTKATSNSTVVSVFSVVANLLFCSLAAFPLARMRFRGRGIVLALVVATILIPFQVVMIPLYLLMVQLGLRNSLMALILPNAATAFGIYLLRQSFWGSPKSWRKQPAWMAARLWVNGGTC